MIKLNPIIYVIIGIFSTSAAQIVLKIGSSYDVMSRKWIAFLFVSIATYSISFLCYYLALKYFAISKIAPIMMMCTVSIVALYGFIAGENINFIRIIGIFLAILSIYLISKF